jgi:hypothetical protein
MFRFKTLALLLTLVCATAVITGCDTGKSGTQSLSPKQAPPSDSQNKLDPVKPQAPPGG